MKKKTIQFFNKISLHPLLSPTLFLPAQPSFKAKGVYKNIQYNNNYVSFLNVMKLKISEKFIEINFKSNIWHHLQIDDQLFVSQAMHIKKTLMASNHFENLIFEISTL